MIEPPFFISLKIPVKPHVKKYISVRYGSEHTLTKQSLLGLLVFNSLDKKTIDPYQDVNDSSDRYTIKISRQYFYERGYKVNRRTLHFLSVCLEKLFYEAFTENIDISVKKHGIHATAAMRGFLSQYDISENDLRFESMYRRYQRHCDGGIKSIKKRTNT